MMHMPGKIGKRGLQLGQNLGRGAGLSSSLLIVELIIRRDHPPQLVLSGTGEVSSGLGGWAGICPMASQYTCTKRKY